MIAIFILTAVLVGSMIPFQALVNAQLNLRIQNPIHAALISFTGGFVTFLVITLMNPSTLPNLKKVTTMSPFLLSGGLIGSVFILAAIICVPRIGPTSWVSLIVAGQLVTSLIIDHYGLMSMPVHSIGLIRIVGVVLLMTGVTLITMKAK